MSNTSTTEHHHHNRLIKRLLIGFLAIFSILFVIQWISLFSSIQNIKQETVTINSSIKKVKTNLIDISSLKQDSLTFTFDKKDIQIINSNLNALASEIYNEKNRAESIIDKDIDRLNLYMALGIGFIAILGVFIPILVNILTNDDLKRKQEGLSEDLGKTKDELGIIASNAIAAKEKADKIDLNALDAAVEKSKEIDGLKEKSDKVIPKLTIITLQIAIHRLFNISSLALSKIAKNPKDNSLFIELFEDVQNAIQYCKEGLLIIEDTKILQQTLMDCKELIIEEEYKFTTFGKSRDLYGELKILSNHFVELSNCKKDDQEAKYNQLNSSFDNFIDKLKSLNA